MGFVKSRAVEKARVFPLEDLGAEMVADAVVHLIAHNRRHRHHQQGQRQAHQVGTAHGPHDEQQRVAGQERHDDQAGFHKNNRKQQGVNRHAVLRHKVAQVHVHVEDEIDKVHEDVHAAIIPCRGLGMTRPFYLTEDLQFAGEHRTCSLL